MTSSLRILPSSPPIVCPSVLLAEWHSLMDMTERYVTAIVNRYANSSTVFAWELMNEARCSGDSLPAGPDCVPGSETLTKWYQSQSDFVRSL